MPLEGGGWVDGPAASGPNSKENKIRKTVTPATTAKRRFANSAMAKTSTPACFHNSSIVHVPYRGGGPAINDLIAGHVDLMIASTAQSVPFIQAGSIRALAQSGKTRTSTLADVPAIAESFPGFEAYAWWGVFAPAGTPKAIVSRFADELAASLREPGVAKQLNETQQVTFALGGPEELRKFVSEQMRLWGPVAREHNIQAD